jgi:hypothetical protein
MQNVIDFPASRQSQSTPEIREAIRTLRSTDWNLEAEYFHLDWASRLELADELRGVLDELPTDEQADVVAGVVRDLESDFEDFSDWTTRCEAAERLRRVVRQLEGGGKPPTPPATTTAADFEDEDDADADRLADWFAGYDTLTQPEEEEVSVDVF